MCNLGELYAAVNAGEKDKSAMKNETTGPIPYGAVVDDGKLYPEFVGDENQTVYERDLLKIAVLDGALIRKALLKMALIRDDEAESEEAWLVLTRFQAAHDGVVGEGGFDFWEAQ